jgi:CheY-like chemotaxis protein
MMAEDEIRHLRVLIANEKRERLELLAQVVAGLGHEVIAREIYVKEVGAVTARERPDVALVGLGLHSEHALDLITEIVREASCPVIALLSAEDPAYDAEQDDDDQRRPQDCAGRSECRRARGSPRQPSLLVCCFLAAGHRAPSAALCC